MQVFDSIFARAQNAWFAFRDEESGQTLVEYALIISLVGLACIAGARVPQRQDPGAVLGRGQLAQTRRSRRRTQRRWTASSSRGARVQNAWFSLRDEESGQTLVEYALIISLVALACIAALGFLSGKIQALFSDAGNSLPPGP